MGRREIQMQLEVSTQAPKISTCLPPDVLSRPMESHDGPIFVFVSVRVGRHRRMNALFLSVDVIRLKILVLG